MHAAAHFCITASFTAFIILETSSFPSILTGTGAFCDVSSAMALPSPFVVSSSVTMHPVSCALVIMACLSIGFIVWLSSIVHSISCFDSLSAVSIASFSVLPDVIIVQSFPALIISVLPIVNSFFCVRLFSSLCSLM